MTWAVLMPAPGEKAVVMLVMLVMPATPGVVAAAAAILAMLGVVPVRLLLRLVVVGRLAVPPLAVVAGKEVEISLSPGSSQYAIVLTWCPSLMEESLL